VGMPPSSMSVARPPVIFPRAEHYCTLAGAELHCCIVEASFNYSMLYSVSLFLVDFWSCLLKSNFLYRIPNRPEVEANNCSINTAHFASKLGFLHLTSSLHCQIATLSEGVTNTASAPLAISNPNL